ncbi:phosphoribosylformylglycinamidine synthase subunit PurS, partial [Lactobacillus acidophilus]
MTTIRIYVTYKPSVFDPQGAAITNSVNSLGHDEVKKIVVGKFFDVTVDEDDLDKVK